MSTKSRQVIWGGNGHGSRDARPRRPGGCPEGNPGGRSGGGGGVVDPHGRLRRARIAVADHWPVSQWWIGLAGGRMQSLQDASEPATRCYPSSPRYAALEAGGFTKMPIMPKGPLRAAGAHDQADRDEGDHALQVGTP